MLETDDPGTNDTSVPVSQVIRHRLDRHPLVCMMILVLLSIAVAGCGVASSHTAGPSERYSIQIDGNVVGYIDSSQAVRESLKRLVRQKQHRLPADDVTVDNEIRIEPVTASDGEAAERTGRMLSQAEIDKLLDKRLRFVTQVTTIVVDGEPVVTVHDRATAEAVLERLEKVYRNQLKQNGQSTQIESVQIMEEVELKSQKAPLTSAISTMVEADKAYDILMRGTTQEVNYEVKKGDNLWEIAQSSDMSVDDLEQANPEVDESDVLQPGEQLSLVVPDPYITFKSRVITVREEEIPFETVEREDDSRWPWQRVVEREGESGKRRVEVEVTWQGESIVDERVLSQEILKEPVNRIVVSGSKDIPGSGNGKLIWPADGIITSHYGWRWGRMHSGVDIGSDYGDPIRAVNSGYVVEAGWDGAFGRRVTIDHGGGFESLYAHMSNLAVSRGQRIKQGEVIGYIGSSGRSTGSHLHFEIRLNGDTVNPVKIFEQRNGS